MNDVCLAGPQPTVSKTPVIYTVPASKTPVFDTRAIMSTQVANTPRFLLVACCYQEGLKPSAPFVKWRDSIKRSGQPADGRSMQCLILAVVLAALIAAPSSTGGAPGSQ